MLKYCWFEKTVKECDDIFCFECPLAKDRYHVDRTSKMFRDDMHNYIRIVLRTNNSYAIMDKAVRGIEDIETRKLFTAQLQECKKDNRLLIDELKKNGHL